jgi:hypothetical protein
LFEPASIAKLTTRMFQLECMDWNFGDDERWTRFIARRQQRRYGMRSLALKFDGGSELVGTRFCQKSKVISFASAISHLFHLRNMVHDA